jgi:hypothetical protein
MTEIIAWLSLIELNQLQAEEKQKTKKFATSFLYICAIGLTYHLACNYKKGETPNSHKYVMLTWLYQSRASVADLGISFPTLLA